MHNKDLSRKSSFTLIELLVVIGIIGILIGILLPAISAALREGKKTQAEADCKMISQAVAFYKNDYQTLPGGSSDNNLAISAAIYQRLGGKTGRQKIYFENTGTYLDPWDGNYYISFDDDYDGDVNVSSSSGSTSVNANVAGSVAVWSFVPGNSYVSSWE